MSPSLPSKSLNSLAAWESEFRSFGLQPEIIDKYLAYITPLLKNKLPVIFNFDHLAKLLGRKNAYLASVINCPEKHYRRFEIPKHSGLPRTILAPYPALKACQSWIYFNILNKLKVENAAHGFSKRRSILTNASMHRENAECLKIDISDFFPSISINRVISLFMKLGYTHKVAFYLASICCYEKALPQGAPTSPCLSNIICGPMDCRLSKLSEKFSITYTRYADDMIFSGACVPWKFYEYAASIIIDNGFTLNTEKTKLLKGTSRKVITGISVASGRLSIPQDYKRSVKAEIYSIEKFGLIQHIKYHRIKKENCLESILGQISYILMVEPENAYFISAFSRISLLRSELRKITI